MFDATSDLRGGGVSLRAALKVQVWGEVERMKCNDERMKA